MSNGDELPDDATALAVLVQDPRTPIAKRDAAMRKLNLVIQRLARGVACSLMVPKQMRSDLVAEASSHVWQHLATFNGQDGKAFAPWCRRMLRNLLIDRLRAAGRQPSSNETDLHVSVDALPEAASLGNGQIASVLDQTLDRQHPFGMDDLSRIRGWKLRDRLVLLVLANLWRKIPADEWRQWVEEFGLVAPFPPNGCTALVSTQLAGSCNLLGCEGWHSPPSGAKAPRTVRDAGGCPSWRGAGVGGRGAEPVRCQLGRAPPQATWRIGATTTVAGMAPERSS